MTTATTFAGFGGQGVLLMGYVLSYGAMLKGLNVTYFPAYGTEIRGGTANCTVIVSEKKIASPVTSHPDILVAMNYPSLIKFESSIKERGLVFINSSLIDAGPRARGHHPGSGSRRSVGSRVGLRSAGQYDHDGRHHSQDCAAVAGRNAVGHEGCPQG